MPPLDRTPQQNRPFKQRKSFGGFPEPGRTRLERRGLTLFSFSAATRKQEVAGIRSKFPNKIPVIIERYEKEKYLPPLDKTKFLVPHELTMTQFVTIIRNRMALLPSQAFYLLINNSGLASMSLTMAQVYKDHQDEDGFLYMTYASQEMFGH
ncbi:microtubule-associated proteins 1A/1B light chain 3C isoform X1 [Fundulus heteroclitus]|uniref:microtubule-associated proteins 1A/1B light chain 3C isoform X1 n=1 Tax=Fundulus heteroclitus TaxID=8078 RepID=UPI00165A8B53|nr:microtubule-associated proteins 1A/1B light chain 3C isoform X1 [Fundulus heteroclitus]